jgi:hypothetical protein
MVAPTNQNGENDEHDPIHRLKSHDWEFRFSDAMRTYDRGMDEFKALKAAAKELDPDHEIWNTYAPEGHKTP